MYIVKTDYKIRLTTDLLEKIIQDGNSNGDDVLLTVSTIAQDTINTLAGVLYDLTAEWSNTGNQRNGLIFSWALSLATYWLYQRIDDADVPGKVIKNYEETMEALENVSKGKHPLNLPPKNNDPGTGTGGDENPVTDGKGLRRIGSRKPRTHSI